MAACNMRSGGGRAEGNDWVLDDGRARAATRGLVAGGRDRMGVARLLEKAIPAARGKKIK